MKLSRRKLAVIKDSQQPVSIWDSAIPEVENRTNAAENKNAKNKDNSTDTKYDLILPVKRFQRKRKLTTK